MGRRGPEKRFSTKLSPVPITGRTKDLLIAVARSRSMTLSGVVREAIDAYIGRMSPEEIEKAKSTMNI